MEERPEARWQKRGKRKKGGMMEGAREGGSEVRGVKVRWREGGGEKARGPVVQGM